MKRRFLSATGIALLLVFCYSLPADVSATAGPNEVSVRVVRVHDGDTVSVMMGKKTEKVRLLGIDAPELGQRPWGANAKRRLRELVAGSGNAVVLEFDLQKRDKYGRLLAYVWARGDALINLEMVRNGYAVLYTFPPNVKG